MHRAILVGTALCATACSFDDAGVALAELAIEPADETALAVDERRALYVVLYYEDGFSEQAPDDEVMWLVDDGTVVEVYGSGEMRGRSIGSTSVHASYRGRTTSLDVEVYDVPRELRVEVERQDIPVGLGRQFRATLQYQHGQQADVTEAVAWSTTGPDIATIDAKGLATGVAPGRVKISAAGYGLQAQRDLDVRPAVAVAVELSPATATIATGDTLQLRADATYSDGNAVDITDVAQWTSSLQDVASVTSSGVVEGRAPGVISITAGRDDAYSITQITVVPAEETTP